MTGSSELIFGTSNRAKIKQVQGALGDTITVRGLSEFDIDIHIEEDGKTAQENAKKKATAYALALGHTVFAMDNALYFNDFPDDEQPGLHVRRVNGIERSSDEDMVKSYTGLIREHGNQIEGWWEFAVSIAHADGTSIEESIISPRIFVSEASATIIPGYPLESIQIDPGTGKYVSEMSDVEQAIFWQRSIGKPLNEFIQANI